MVDDMAHLFTAVFGVPLLAMIGVVIGWSMIDAVLTGLLWPWRNRK